jgi:hypothetical protein
VRTGRELRGAWQNFFAGPKSEGIFCFTQGCYSLWDLKSWVKWEEALGLHTATHTEFHFFHAGAHIVLSCFKTTVSGRVWQLMGCRRFVMSFFWILKYPLTVYTKQSWLLDLTIHLLSSGTLWLSTETDSKVCIYLLYAPTYLHCATSRKIAGLIPDGIIGIFYWHNPWGTQ